MTMMRDALDEKTTTIHCSSTHNEHARPSSRDHCFTPPKILQHAPPSIIFIFFTFGSAGAGAFMANSSPSDSVSDSCEMSIA
jgi:hypothetical protein